jgi:PAS domain S-box-containing protein
MDHFMQRVTNVWYRIYWGWMLLYSLGLGIVYIGTRVVPNLAAYQDRLALSSIMLVLICLHILYSCTVYWWVRRHDVPLATVIGAMFFVMIVINGFTVTEHTAWALVYVIPWVLTGIFSGTFGLPLTLGAVLFTEASVLQNVQFHVMSMGRMAASLAIADATFAALGYLFWRGRFINSQSQAVSQLSIMLRADRQQSEILIQSIADAVIVVNMEGRISLMNPAAAAMTEWTIDEALGIDAHLVVQLAQENGDEIMPEQNPFTEVLQANQRISQTVQLSGRSGRKQIISLVISPVLLPSQATPVGAVAVMRDITEARAAEEQRAEFISTASHEMRTPLATIEGFLSLALNDKVSTIDPRAKGYLEKAHAATEHLGSLFQDLLTSSRAEDGRISNHPVVLEMGTYLQQLSDELKFTAQNKKLDSEFVIGSSHINTDPNPRDVAQQHLLKPLYYVLVDPERLREIVTNLFDNACKYTIEGKISIGLTGNSDVVQFYIRDTGTGIPKDDVLHLFQKFYRVDNSATRTIGGTGLGLFICRKIVELYHGRIWVESELGKGSTFFVNIPRLSPERASELLNIQNASAVTPTSAPTQQATNRDTIR